MVSENKTETPSNPHMKSPTHHLISFVHTFTKSKGINVTFSYEWFAVFQR